MRGYSFQSLTSPWALRTWAHVDALSAPHFILPHREISLVACLDDDHPSIRLFGGSSRAYSYTPHPGVEHYGVALAPEQAIERLDLHPADILGDMPTVARALHDQLERALFALLDLPPAERQTAWLAAVVQAIGHIGTPGRVEHHAARLIRRTHGRIGIAALSDRLDLSARQLQRRFSERIGLTPKAYARLARLTRATELADRRAQPDWAAIAVECGYSDQAHFVRESVAQTGLSPKRLHARRHATSEIFNTAVA